MMVWIEMDKKQTKNRRMAELLSEAVELKNKYESICMKDSSIYLTEISDLLISIRYCSSFGVLSDDTELINKFYGKVSW